MPINWSDSGSGRDWNSLGASTSPSLSQRLKTGLKGAGKLYSAASRFPMEAIGAGLGTPERFISGMIGAHQRGKYGLLPVLGSGFYGVGHPGQQQQLDVWGEKALGLSGLKSQDPRFRGKLQNFGVDMLYENITDPLNLLFASGLIRGVALKGTQKVADILSAGARRIGSKMGGEQLRQMFTISPEIKTQGGTRAAQALAEGPEIVARQVSSEWQKQEAKILQAWRPVAEQQWDAIRAISDKKNRFLASAAKATEKGDVALAKRYTLQADALKLQERTARKAAEALPEPVKSVFDRWAFVLGQPQVRALTRAEKFVPGELEKGLQPVGVLGRRKQVYAPHPELRGETPPKELALPSVRRIGTAKPGFIYRQGTLIPETPIFDRVVERLATYHSSFRNLYPRAVAVSAFKMPDIAATTQAIARETDPLRKARFEALLKRQQEKAASVEQRVKEFYPGGAQMQSMAEFGMAPNTWLGEASLAPQAWRTVLRRRGLTPGKLQATGTAVDVPKLGQKPKATARLKGILAGQQSMTYTAERAVNAVMGMARDLPQDVQKLLQRELTKGTIKAEDVLARVGVAGQAGVARAERAIAKEPMMVPQGPKGLLAGTRKEQEIVGKLAASAAKTAGDVTVAPLRALDYQRLRAANVPANEASRIAKALEKISSPQARRWSAAQRRIAGVNAKLGQAEQFNELLDSLTEDLRNEIARQMDIHMPLPQLQRSFGKQVRYEPVQALAGLSESSRQAMFSNPLVHEIKNVGSLQVMGPAGVTGFLKGVAIATGMGGKQFFRDAAERLMKMGALPSFVRTDIEELGKVTGTFARLAKPAKSVTQRGDVAQRIVLLHTIDNMHDIAPGFNKPYNKLTEFEKGQVIRDTLGGYQHTSAASKMLRAYTGSYFPFWPLFVIARTARAFIEAPHRLNQLQRFVNTANQDFFSDKPYQVETYTPAEEAVAHTTHPISGALSVAGPVGVPLRMAMYHEKLPQIVEELAGRYLPYGSVVEQLAGLSPYVKGKAKLSPAILRAVLSALGMSVKAKL